MMNDETTRRHAAGLLVSGLMALQAVGQTGTRPPVRELARQALTGPNQGMEAILVEVTTMGGATSVTHRHPGFVLGYVLEGTLRFAINGEGQRLLKAGETFFEPLGALHTTGESADAHAPVRFSSHLSSLRRAAPWLRPLSSYQP
jgi:quercetin dioxygenase-like cupin family protein